MKIFLALFLLATPCFAAEKKPPIYKQPLPAQICSSALEIDSTTGSCNDNAIFLKSADECWAKVKSIHNQVTKEYKARIGGNLTDGQSQDFSTSKADQSEAVAAHDYMLKITQQALDELDKYFDYVVQPDDVESDEEILNSTCYHDVVVPMDGIAEQMENKIEEMKKSKSMESAMGATSGSRETNTGSLSAPIAPGKKAATGAPPPSVKAKAGTTPQKGNTITGVEEDKKKRSQQK